MNVSLGIFLIGIILLINACQGEGQKKSKKDNDVLEKSEIKEKVRDVVYPLPSTFEVVEMLNNAGASYILAIANPVSNVDKYFTHKDQAINLGIYVADLSYASTYNMQQDIMNYMEVTEQLVKELGIAGAFSISFIEDVEANINNKDKLVELITDAFYNTYEYLVKHDKEDLSLLVVAGAWIEGLYISTNISETTFQDTEIVKAIMNQKQPLAKLLELLKPHTNHETIQQLLIDLEPIFEVYNNIEEGGITESQLNDITERISTIRNDLIE